MKILTINYEYPPVGGGGGVASKQIAEGLVRLNHEVDVVTSRASGLPRQSLTNGVRIFRSYTHRKNKSTASLSSLLTYPITGLPISLKRCIVKNYDCIHSHFVVPSGVLGFVLSNVLEIPHLVSIHGGDIYDPTKTLSPHNSDVMQKVVSRLLKSADQVVAQSSDIKSRAYDYYSLPNVDIETIPLPYESVSFDKLGVDELGLDENKTYIVSIGRLVKRKGYKYLIESIATLPTEIELLLIGDGPEEERLRRLADDLGVLSRIEFLGHVSEKNKFNYLDKSSVFVMSSLHEGFGIVLQEAMQVGLPIVTTDTGGQTDLVEDDVHGRIVSAKDPNALSRAILEVLEDNTTDYETNAYQKLEEYDLDRICKMYVNQFNKITK